jgi:predicted transposase YbfD/YdcC
VWVTSDIDWLDETDDPAAWVGLTSVARLESARRVKDKEGNFKEGRENHYFLCSFAADAKRVLQTVRAHWGIENRLHWTLDVAFREEACRVRKNNAPENLATLRKIALNLLKQEQTEKASIKSKRLKAGWDEQYLVKVLTQTDTKTQDN